MGSRTSSQECKLRRSPALATTHPQRVSASAASSGTVRRYIFLPPSAIGSRTRRIACAVTFGNTAGSTWNQY